MLAQPHPIPAPPACAVVVLRQEARRRADLLETGRNVLKARAATAEHLRAAIEVLTRYGDHIDMMRAELLRAALRRREALQ
ncbi:MAG: hypothetical protein PHX82_11230 [Paracoccaceae bacterium]|nr:hypothetical protein [Paracoccaceae bacterium]